MNKAITAIGLAISCSFLGGCQSIFGWTAKDDRPNIYANQSVDLSDYFFVRLESGRQHLAENRPTRAIDAFRQASYDPRHRPEAFNGMAIAYARIGRPDLARRYFGFAMSLDPSDERFDRNLAKLESQAEREEQSYRLAAFERTEMAGASDSLVLPASPTNKLPEPLPTGVEAPRPASPLLRTGSREVRVTSPKGPTKGVFITAAKATVKVSQPRKVATSSRVRVDYPIHLELPQARPVAGRSTLTAAERIPAKRAKDYPVRIVLAGIN